MSRAGRSSPSDKTTNQPEGNETMVQVILNGLHIGHMTNDNLDAFIRQARVLTIISRTATTACFEG